MNFCSIRTLTNHMYITSALGPVVKVRTQKTKNTYFGLASGSHLNKKGKNVLVVMWCAALSKVQIIP